MSDEKNKASDIAKNIWLAGVGAYGKAVEEAQGRIEKAMEPPKLFRDLVKVGTALEEDARESTVAARQSVEERINRVRDNFQNQRPARLEDLAKLQKKVDRLSKKVDRLSKALKDQQTLATPVKHQATAAAKAKPKKRPTTKKAGVKKVARRAKTKSTKSATRKSS